MGKHDYTTTEYGIFLNGVEAAGCVTLPERTFRLLRDFVLSDSSGELLGLSSRRGLGEVIAAKNYVGVIGLPDGSVIQILPKIYSAVQDDDHRQAQKLLLNMLRTLKDVPNQTLHRASLNTVDMDILEIFIRMFLDELLALVQRGLKCGYERVEENLGVIKGKLLFSEQLRCNYAHRECCYVAYDAFTVNRPENRLIKTTLLRLYRHSNHYDNRKDIKRLLQDMEGVEHSTNIQKDFTRCATDRSMRDYGTILNWCRVFLSGRSFGTFSGNQEAIALLYPMEKLFESYVAAKLKRGLNGSEYQVTAQDRTYWLCEEPNQFALRPDLVIRREADQTVFVLDTKWKLLDQSKHNWGISQGDMYQMYAYQKKYSAQHMTLIYPKPEWADENETREFHDADGFHVQVRFVDLFRMEERIREFRELRKQG